MRPIYATLAILGLGLIASSCGGGSGNSGSPAQAYKVSGSVSGLHGVGLTLKLNGANPVTITADGPFAFATEVAGGTPYTVSATADSAWTACTVSNGNGAPNADVTNVSVSCGAAKPNVTRVAGDAGGTWGVAIEKNGTIHYTTTSVAGIGVVAKLTPDLTFSRDPNYWPYRPVGIAVDGNGNVFVAEIATNAVDVIGTDGTIASIGSGFKTPYGVTLDNALNVYVADTGNNAVKKIAVDGTVTTLGNGFNAPRDVKVDSAGNVFVADTGNNAIKKISASGTVTSIGSGFKEPNGIEIDKSGTVYVADTGNSLLKAIAPDGTVTTLVSSVPGDYGMNSPFEGPSGVAIDSNGSLIVSDGNVLGQLLRFTPSN